MDKALLLQEEIQSFIKAHEKDDLPVLVMQKKYAHLPLRIIAEQIKSKKKAEKKLPTWYKTEGILYPPAVSIEQSSSEIAAKHKAELVRGKSSLDLTGGFGVDSFFLAQRFATHTYVEANEDLADLAQHNFLRLGQDNIKVVATTANEFLLKNKQRFDLIYIDPDRRPGNKRVMGFEESKPDILGLLPRMFSFSDKIIVKASPMLDITLAISQLNYVTEVIILAIDNDVKELLFFLEKNTDKDIKIRAVNKNKGALEVFDFNQSERNQESSSLHKIADYLFEPNAAIMKSGGYNLLGNRFGLQKLAVNTHLYTTNVPPVNFPGRCFRVKGNVVYTKQQVHSLLVTAKANISTRNFPDTPEQIKKKLGLKDGGEQYLFGYRDLNNRPMIAVCEKYSQSDG